MGPVPHGSLRKRQSWRCHSWEYQESLESDKYSMFYTHFVIGWPFQVMKRQCGVDVKSWTPESQRSETKSRLCNVATICP